MLVPLLGMYCRRADFDFLAESFPNAYSLFLAGKRFVKGNVIIRTTRLYYTPAFSASKELLEDPPPSPGDAKPLDPSGLYLVEAMVQMEDNSSSAIRDKAIKELLDFAETVKGAIDFRVSDRLALEPKVEAV